MNVVRSTGPISLRLVLLLAWLTALDAMAIDMYTPALPAIRDALEVSASSAANSLSIFLVGMAIGQGLFGPLLDRFGRRTPLLAATLLFVIGSAVCALAPSYPWFVTGRVVQALGAAGGVVAPRALVSDRCEPQAAARVFSLLMQVFMVAPIAAPLAGSVLLQHAGWRTVFWALSIFGVGAAVWAFLEFPESLPPAKRVRRDPLSIATAYARLLAHAPFATHLLAGSLITASLFSYLGDSAFVFIERYGLTPVTYALVFGLNAVGLMLAAEVNKRLLRHLQPGSILLGALTAYAAAAAVLAVASALVHVPLPVYETLLFLALGSLGVTFGNNTALVLQHAGADKGLGSALLGVAQGLMGATCGFVLAWLGGFDAMVLAMAICGVAALALSSLAAWLTGRDRSHEKRLRPSP